MEFSHTSPTNSVAPVAVFPDHFAAGAELLVTSIAILAVAAGCHVVHADTIAPVETSDIPSAVFDDTGDFVTQCSRHRVHGRDTSTVVRVRVADAGRHHPNEHIPRSDLKLVRTATSTS